MTNPTPRESEREYYGVSKDGICYYCGKITNNLSANPGDWSIPLCHRDEPGKVKYHHERCVSERLLENQPYSQKYKPMSVEEIANIITFQLESGGWNLMSTFLNSGDVVGVAKAIHDEMERK